MLLLGVTFAFAGNRDGVLTPHWVHGQALPYYTGGYNMGVAMAIHIDGVPIANPNYELCAFQEGVIGPDGELVGAQLRGAFPATVQSTGNYVVGPTGAYVYMPAVYGYANPAESPGGNRLIFKIYDHETEQVLDLISNCIVYNQNWSWQHPSHPLVISFFTPGYVWEKVTDPSTLADGDVIFITNADGTRALNQFQDVNNRKSYPITVNPDGTITWETPVPYEEIHYDEDGEEIVNIVTDKIPQEILIHGVAEGLTMFVETGFLYAASSTNNLLMTYINETGGGYTSDCIWTFTANGENSENVDIVAQGTNTRATLRYANNSTRFSCYAGTTNQSPVCIYRKTAAPEVVEYNVNATAVPADGGSIQLDGADFTSGTFEAGTELTLTAVPAEGKIFDGWGVNGFDPGVSSEVLTITVNEDTQIEAYFVDEPIVYYILTYNVDPAEAGTITATPAMGENGYEAGTTVTLTATPADETWIFDEWQNEAGEAVSALNPYEFDINANTALAAKFHQEIPVVYYTLTVNVDPAEAGTYTVDPAAGDEGYEAGAEVTVTATANEGWSFVKWMNAADETLGSNPEYTVVMNNNTEIFAIFEALPVVEPYTVTLNAGSGTCDVTELTEAEAGAGVTLPKATPCDAAITAGYTFAGWAAAEVAETTTAPELFNGAYAPEADITLYAVYAMGGETYTFKNGDNYLAWSSGNSLKTIAEVNDNSKWNVTFDGEKAIISPITQDVEREIAWNNQSTGQRFAAYKHTSLYNNDGSMSANYGAITLFSDDVAVTSLAENDVVVLASETVKKELSTVGNYGTGADYTDAPAGLYPLTVGIEGEPAVYNTNPSCEGPVVTQDPVITPNSGAISTPSVMVEITCPTEDAVIYFTLDGSTPTAESTVYTAPIEITETTTVSAIAIVEGGEPSNVVTATYTFPEIATYPNIAAFKAAYDATSSEIAKITGDVTFVFRGGRYMFVQDETAALLIYDNSEPVITNTYENGDVISGGITGTMNVYNGQKELVPTANPAEGVAGTPVEPTVVAAADVVANYADYDAMLVKMEGVTFDEDHTFGNTSATRSTTFTQDETNYTIFNRFNNLTITVAAGQEGDVTGFIGIFNDTKQMYPRNDEDIELVVPEPETVTITATANPAIGGTVEGAGEYEVGEEVTLTATAAEGYVFVNWTEGDTEVGTDAILTFSAEADRDLVANFEEETPVEPETYTITATANPAIGGTVEGAGEYEEGATVTLTATAAEGYVFVNWTEGDTEVGTDATLTFTAEADRDLVANFEEETPEPEMFIVIVSADPAEGGNVTITPAAGENGYEAGTDVTVTATANEGWTFKKWMEDDSFVSSNPSYTFTVNGNRELVAIFEEVEPEPETYTITATANPAIGGTVEGAGEYEEDATVTLTATAAEGYVFVNWTEGDTEVGTDATLTFTAEADRDLVANFEEETPEPEVYTITVLPNANGTVTAPATAEAGETINVTATPNPLHVLTGLYYYTTDPEDVTEIDLEEMSFEMPAANVTIGAEFASVADMGDVNNDDQVNILDVLAVLNYILGKDPQPFDFEQADMNEDGVIDISDAMAINALILSMKGDCGQETALYDVVNGKLVIQSPVALAGYQFSLSAEPASVELAGFTTMGNWVNGEYIFLVFNLNSDQEAGVYEVLDLNGANVNNVALATLAGCKVNAEKGALNVNDLLEANYNLFPVPANTVVNVEGEGINFIEVFNVMGQHVMTVNTDTNTVNVSGLTPGAYLFRMNTVNGVVTKNVIIVR